MKEFDRSYMVDERSGRDIMVVWLYGEEDDIGGAIWLDDKGKLAKVVYMLLNHSTGFPYELRQAENNTWVVHGTTEDVVSGERSYNIGNKHWHAMIVMSSRKSVHDGDGQCERVCGIQYSDLDQVATCPIPNPPEWPPMLQLPDPRFRAVRTNSISFGDLPSEGCRDTGSCPVTVLMTGSNQSLGESLGRNMFPSSSNFNSSNGLAGVVLGSASQTDITNFLDSAFYSDFPIYYVQSQCGANSTFSLSVPIASLDLDKEIRCAQGQHLWRNSSSDINNELYAGYRKGNPEEKINEILAGYDFMNSNMNNYNVTVWYNSTYKNDTGNGPLGIVRVPRSINLVSNAFLQLLVGPSTQMLFDFIKEMPKPETEIRLDFSSLLGPLFFTWVILQLFPIVLTGLVYEKQQNLRIMMKMHGLGDGPYWIISYAYFLAISLVYMFCFVAFGSAVGLKFFTLNDYSIQFVFYFIYINLQISMAFLVAALFSNLKTAAVVGYITVFATGLLGGFFFQFFLQDKSFSRVWIVVMELYPGFSLYAGLYEFSEYAFTGNYIGTDGMHWGDISDSNNEMRHAVSSGSGARKSPLFFLQKFKKNSSTSFRKPSLQRQGSKRERVEQSILEQDTSHAIVCDNLKKVYPGRDGNPEKFAVRGLSLALSQGECFGMLGPNGAGKTSFINMTRSGWMIGLIKPSSGTAYVQGLDITTNMDQIYANMGAVEESLKSVNLFNGGVADKQAGKYSGGMKRRLSVAISLIGDPKPTT
ncbi:hypothetical protein M8C21_002989 [Ambrosia artemisiifolia]|uniref:ABC transporter domain-containing protein n=1 Tax=Ambrosia artemisiifolia TaxID=4212 RepID=A0AAD5G6V8_AMBAR|nr:hypothetical protein M8C21_002989 [Ambrosia artemisiifolia]